MSSRACVPSEARNVRPGTHYEICPEFPVGPGSAQCFALLGRDDSKVDVPIGGGYFPFNPTIRPGMPPASK